MSGTQNVICVFVHNHVQKPSSAWRYYDTSFGTVMIKIASTAAYNTQAEAKCLQYGDFLRPFVPRSSTENDWFNAYYDKVLFSSNL